MSEDITYTEKLWPAWWIWVAALIIGASVSVMFFPIDVIFGVIGMIVGVSLCLLILLITTPRVEITATHLRVGRAQIPRELLGQVAGHSGDAARQQLGPGFDARSFQCIRGWINPVVTVEIADAEDPTPYWLFSTRHPQRVVEALGSSAPVHGADVSPAE